MRVCSREGRREISYVVEIKACSQMLVRSVLVCNVETCKNFSSSHVESRSIFNLLVRMDDSFGTENCGIRKKRHCSVHRLLHLSVSRALRSGNKSQYLNNGLDFINDFSP